MTTQQWHEYEALIFLEDMVLCELHEDPDPAQTDARRGPENPALDLTLWRGWINTEKTVSVSASAKSTVHLFINKMFVGNRAELCEWYEDISYYQQAHRLQTKQPLDYVGIIELRYWRACHQNIVYQVFLLLVQRGYLDLSLCFRRPVTYAGSTPSNIGNLERYLSCLSAIQDSENTYGLAFWSSYSTHITWLAIMIIRGGNDAADIWRTILDSQLLGSLDAVAWDKLVERGKTWTFERDTMAGNIPLMAIDTWLPLGPHNFADPSSPSPHEVTEFLRVPTEDFNAIERLFKSVGKPPMIA